jgi:hypothetical protein
VLKGLPKVQIGAVGIDDAFKISSQEGRKVILEVLLRYNIPVHSDTSSVATTLPFLTLIANLVKTKEVHPLSSRILNFRMELWEHVKLVRDPGNDLYAPVWSREDGLIGAAIDREEVISTIRSLAEQFCLSYLSANRQ